MRQRLQFLNPRSLSSIMAQDNENQGHALPSPQILRPRSRSPASSSRIEIKNRRKRYLDTHTEYLSSPSLELAGLPSMLNVLGVH